MPDALILASGSATRAKMLRDAGVVVSERQGTNIVYSLSPDFSRRWSAIGASLAGLVQVA